MISRQTKEINNLDQAGVTLLLSILVLSALVAISFSFVSIILIEIRSSGDVARTEPALYATQGVVEQIIFKIKRAIPPNSVDSTNPYNFDFGKCDQDTPVTAGIPVATYNNVALSSGICTTNPEYDVKDLVHFSTGPESTNSIYNLYDPESPYTNTACVGGTQPGCVGGTEYPSAYSKIEFTSLDSPGAFATIYFCAADKDCFDPQVGWDDIQTITPTDRSLVYDEHSFPSISPDTAYQFFVVNSNPSLDAGIEIKSWGPDPRNDPQHPRKEAEKGLPVFGKSTVDVIANYLGLTRKYQVEIPNE